MATYKVIQDIEAEDKLVGPLTLRQFIYACIAAVFAYLSFIAISKGFAAALIVLGPPMLFTGFLAFPWGGDQSTEVWALAKLRFYFKSRRRLWDQSGTKSLVTITAPKHEVHVRTNGLSTRDVQSRLNALANTLDSRGWAVKNVYSIPPAVAPPISDRLVDARSMPQQVVQSDFSEADDIMDSTNANTHRLEEMVTAASASHKQQLLDHMQRGDMPAPTVTNGQGQAGYWFTNNPISLPQPAVASPVTTSTSDEVVLSEELHKRHDSSGNDNLKTIAPLASTPPQAPAAPTNSVATPPADPATIHLSQRDDLTVSTISRIAKGEDEVVISLH